MPVPDDNPLTLEKVTLGRRLFSDTILSRNRRLACVTCHDPGRAFTDGRPVAVGIFGRTDVRNVPTLANWGYGSKFFWDGRVARLEAQVLEPIRARKEMDLPLGEAVERLRDHREHPTLFGTVFGREITTDDLAGFSRATFVRSYRVIRRSIAT